MGILSPISYAWALKLLFWSRTHLSMVSFLQNCVQSNSSLLGSGIKLCCPYCCPVQMEDLATSFRKKKANRIDSFGQTLFLKSRNSMLTWASKLSKGSNLADQSHFMKTWWNVRVDRLDWLFPSQSCFLTHFNSLWAYPNYNFSKLYLLA